MGMRPTRKKAEKKCPVCSQTGKVPEITMDSKGNIIRTGKIIKCHACKGKGLMRD